jgi:hypothetical protein
VDGDVLALATRTGSFGVEVFAGGSFDCVYDGPYVYQVNHVAKWMAAYDWWSWLSSGMSATVRTVAIDGSTVYAGGDFTRAGGIRANRVAAYGGSGWEPVGSGANHSVQAMAIGPGFRHIGGKFSAAGGGQASGIARWKR